MEQQEFQNQVESQGYVILPDILPSTMLPDLKRDLALAIDKEGEYRLANEVASHHGMVLLCSLYGGSLVEVLNLESLMRPFEWVLGKGCIIYAYTSSSMPPNGTNSMHGFTRTSMAKAKP